MDRRRRAARTVALMSLFTMTDTQTNVPIASFDGDGSDLISLIVGIEPVQAGSGDPSPDNVRPISGWTECKVTRTGVNVWDEEWELGVFNNSTGEKIPSSSNIRSTNYIGIKPGKSYAFIKPEASRVFWYGIDKSFISTVVVPTNTRVITAPDRAYYLMFQISGTTYNHDISINYPSTDTTYHAYTGTTYPIPLGQTVYGGTLDVTTGKLTVDRAYYTWQSGGYLTTAKAFAIRKDDVININPQNQTTLIGAICDKLKGTTWADIANRPTEYLAGCVYGNGLAIRIPDFTTAEEYTAWLAKNTPSFCYLLNTPITIDLTPTEVSTLIGTNNIWADTGDIKYIEYNI